VLELTYKNPLILLADFQTPTALREVGTDRLFYDRKRAEGKLHTQAVLALARRRVNVLWALIRDRRRYEHTPPYAKAA
jgi:hypothetical protein